jgi:hypothetical protein
VAGGRGGCGDVVFAEGGGSWEWPLPPGTNVDGVFNCWFETDETPIKGLRSVLDNRDERH